MNDIIEDTGITPEALARVHHEIVQATKDEAWNEAYHKGWYAHREFSSIERVLFGIWGAIGGGLTVCALIALLAYFRVISIGLI